VENVMKKVLVVLSVALFLGASELSAEFLEMDLSIFGMD
jgi:hypothetical protein